MWKLLLQVKNLVQPGLSKIKFSDAKRPQNVIDAHPFNGLHAASLY